MFLRFKNNYRLYSELFRFQYQTFRNRLAIQKAYAEERPTVSVRRVLTLLIAVVSVGVVATVSLVGVRSILSHQAKIRSLRSTTEVVTLPQNDLKVEAEPQPESRDSTPAANPVVAVSPDNTPPLDMWVPPAQPDYALVVNKSSGQMFVLDVRPAPPRVIHDYRVATGEKSGRKKIQGDRKSPEGVYFIVGRKERSELEEIYGPLAYVLNYPNKDDRKAGRTGDGIWIHGTSPDSIPITTRGCVEMHNADLLALSGILRLGIATPVIIVDRKNLNSPLEVFDKSLIVDQRSVIRTGYVSRTRALSTFVQKWTVSWSSRNMADYAPLYDTTRFSGQGLTWTEWKAKKQATFDYYSAIDVTVENVLVTEFSKTTAVLKFVQKYESNLTNLVNAKKLALDNRSGKWRIYSEVTFPQEEMPL